MFMSSLEDVARSLSHVIQSIEKWSETAKAVEGVRDSELTVYSSQVRILKGRLRLATDALSEIAKREPLKVRTILCWCEEEDDEENEVELRPNLPSHLFQVGTMVDLERCAEVDLYEKEYEKKLVNMNQLLVRRHSLDVVDGVLVMRVHLVKPCPACGECSG